MAQNQIFLKDFRIDFFKILSEATFKKDFSPLGL